jgi:predicted metal-dependent peptidase
MSTIDKDKILSKAKIGLLTKTDATFIATIVMSLKSSWASEIPNPDGSVFQNRTACTDGVNLILNEDWFLDLNPLEQVGLLAHEAWHVALQHVLPDRRKDRDPRVWNQAADHVINNMLVAAKYRIPKGGLCDPAYKDMSVEQVYKILMDDPNKQDPNFTPDFMTGPGQDDPAAQQAHSNQVKDTLVRAATQAKLANDGSAGAIPGDVLVALDTLLYPKLPWSVLLADFFNGLAKEDYSFSKPNRRFLPEFYLPSLFSEGMGTLACAVDTSGSVSDEDFKAFATEMDYIKETLLPEQMYVVDFDTQINSIYQIGDNDSVKQLKFKGRGGTSLDPVFEHFKDKPPQVLVVFSDLECNSIDQDPGYPVLWIRTPGSGHTPTFGRLIEFDPHN